ncbi:MAG: amino acid decarboxylase [Oscillospiraceae bacterium]|jgi:arginine/lysine/ornithine decarboxylase|nr:amino acid decarboxylase [Oscillospiraceae bacterium]
MERHGTAAFGAPYDPPLLSALREYASARAYRFHIPGHKGSLPPPLSGAAKLDFTESAACGNLYSGGGPIRRAEEKAAERFGAAHCLFLTGGATQGVYAMLAAYVPEGGVIYADRACHKSVHHAMAALDITPRWLARGTIEPFGAPAPLAPRPLAPAACVFLTTPTYYGTFTSVSGWGLPAIADAAHGAHLGLPRGAAAAVCSAHKTLPALGQAAFILTQGEPDLLRYYSSVFGTSSPSYPVMASMDYAVSELSEEMWAQTREYAEGLRERHGNIMRGGDPTRLVVYTGSGYAHALRAEREYGVVCEMADRNNVMFVLTPRDTCESRRALEKALAAMDTPMPPVAEEPAPPLPKAVMSIRSALFAPGEPIAPARSAGRVAARPACPFPPGVPLVAPGELIDEETGERLARALGEGEYVYCVKE